MAHPKKGFYFNLYFIFGYEAIAISFDLFSLHKCKAEIHAHHGKYLN